MHPVYMPMYPNAHNGYFQCGLTVIATVLRISLLNRQPNYHVEVGTESSTWAFAFASLGYARCMSERTHFKAYLRTS